VTPADEERHSFKVPLPTDISSKILKRGSRRVICSKQVLSFGYVQPANDHVRWDSRRGGDPHMSEWPSFYPDDCPPADAEDSQGVVFHLVSGDPMPPSDLKDTAFHRDAFPEEDDCLRVALSCYRREEELRQIRSSVPRLSDRKIARADLQPDYGKLLQTRAPSHHSLWIRNQYYADANEWFEVME